MKETPVDTAQAIGLALLLHALLFALLFIGLWWTRSAAPAAAGAVQAELMDANDLSTAMQRTLRQQPQPIEEEAAPPPQPLPEPVPEEAPTPQQQQPQDFIPVPDVEDQVAVVEQPTPTPSVEKELQEAKRRQEQIDLTEQERQQEAERKQRLSQMELERLKQLEDIRRRRAQATREAELAEQKLKQIADARARSASEEAAAADASASTPGQNGVDEGLLARYRAALQATIASKWTRPDSVPVGARCRIHIRQLPGGSVMSAEVSSPCAYDEQGRRSIEAAVLKAQPLPYAGFESVFSRELIINFEAQDR